MYRKARPASTAVLLVVILAVGAVLATGGESRPAELAALAATDMPRPQEDVCVDCLPEADLLSPTATATPLPTPTPAPISAYETVPLEVPARAVAILEAPCGALLYGKDEHLPLPPASLTKIVTALTAIGRVDLDDTVEVTVSAFELQQQTRSSVMGLEPGMSVTVEDLLYGLLLPSGNDAAIELAQHVSGDVDSFVALMNQEAKRLGMNNSRFTNPHGLGYGRPVSTAYDMAIAGMAMMQDPTLAAMAGAAAHTGSSGLNLSNGNRLLGAYLGSNGVKIGYTRSARHTIVGSAVRDGRHLFVAVLGSDNLYPETTALLDWAFASTEPQCDESS